jgi:DNA invertase Pin-like site-specific DNA recombinase
VKTALYLRVSDPDKGQTTDNQLAQLEEWCEHKGHEITEVYRDDESGRRGRAKRSDDDSAHAEIDPPPSARL